MPGGPLLAPSAGFGAENKQMRQNLKDICHKKTRLKKSVVALDVVSARIAHERLASLDKRHFSDL